MAARDLCTLADVTGYVPGYTSNTATNAILTDLITSVSTEIQTQARREVMPIATNPQTRYFDLSDRDVYTRKVFIGDLKSTTSLAVTTEDHQAVLKETITSSNYVLLERNRQEWEPYNRIWFPTDTATPATLDQKYVLKIVGTWGFPSVPTDLKQACIKLVIVRYVNDVGIAGTAFADALNDGNFNLSAAFRSAQDTIDSYKLPTVY